MNFLDTYDITGTSTPPNNDVKLNDEVNQVLGQLNDLWSWGKKRSQAAFETARKDLTEVVSQAQTEISRFTSEGAANEGTTGEGAAREGAASTSEETSNELAASSSSEPTEAEIKPTTTTAQTFFSRIQSAIPPNVVSAVQSNIPESLKHASENIDLVQLRTTLSHEFQRVQGVTRTQAEEYMHKSESLLREVMKEAGDALRDAVKVIPPDQINSNANSGLLWDGTDMWMLPDPSDGEEVVTGKGKGKASVQRAVATRAEALLKRLRQDPDILRHDPEADEGVKSLYVQWLSSEVESQEGGIGGATWMSKISSSLNDSEDGQSLQASLDTLVPSAMTNETFWKRYFFRVRQIEQEEVRRKALIEDSIATEDDFSWEDDEEEGVVSSPKNLDQTLKTKSSTNTLQPSEKTVENSANTSPRESSEESYDVVSHDGDKKPSDSDDGDSDWE